MQDKHHFFIGNILKNEEQIKLLKNIQRKLIKKYRLKGCHWNNKFCANFIYLGYLDEQTAYKYMDNIMSHLLTQISNRIQELTCKYTDYKIDSDKSYHKISLKFIDTENKLISIIVQYLHKNGILPIYPNRKKILKPFIDLVYYKEPDMKDEIRSLVPIDNFVIDHLSLIKGTPIRMRSGAPSLHDQMNFEEIFKYDFPLVGEVENNNENNISS